MVELTLYGPFRDAVGEKTVDHPADGETTVGNVMRSLADAHPDVEAHLFEDGSLRASINVLKNGQNVDLLDGEATPVEDGDRLAVTVSLEGGSDRASTHGSSAIASSGTVPFGFQPRRS